MRLFGLEITRQEKALNTVVENRGGWMSIIRESFSGAWQQNVEVNPNQVLAFHAVFSCMTLIASDIAKLQVRLVKLDEDGIWTETINPAYSPVLRKPNHFQNRIQFWENWILSKLTCGNTVVLKRRDGRGVVVGLYVLDWARVKPLVADDGSVFYELQTDNISGLPDTVVVPAREIIHDRFNCLFHPLIGVSPIYACGLAATQGLAIQNNATRLFNNGGRPGGLLSAPGKIDSEAAARLKAYWDDNFTGANAGKVAVLGDGLKFETLSLNAVDAQVIEQLKWTAEVVCGVLHVPPHKVGVGAAPSYNNIEALDQQYYSQAIQIHIESAELCLDEGLGMGPLIGTEFDLDGLLRMDTATMVKAEADAVGAGIKKPNEARRRLNLKPVDGGDTPYLQEQNYSLAALAKRDAGDPFAKPAAEPAPAAANDDEAEARAALAVANERAAMAEVLNAMRKGLG